MKSNKIDRIKLAVWDLAVTYEETSKKLRKEAKSADEGGDYEEWEYKQQRADIFGYMARGASNAYLAICAACKNK